MTGPVDDDRDRVPLEDDHLRGTYALGPDWGLICEDPIDDWDNPLIEASRKRYRRMQYGDRGDRRE